MAAEKTIAVYDFSAWNGSLAATICNQPLLLSANVQDFSSDVLARLPKNTRYFLFHVDLSLSARFPRDRTKLIQFLRVGGVKTFNGALVDIRKRKLRTVLQRAKLPTASAPRSGNRDEIL